jgi:hypothetical protein
MVKPNHLMRRYNMRTIKLYTLSVAAGLLLGGVAHADDSALFGRGGYAGESMQRSVDAPRERTVELSASVKRAGALAIAAV